MDLPDLDEEIKKIIAKADQIVHLEQLQKDRIETLTGLREEDGRLKISIQQNKKELLLKKENLKIAQKIWNENQQYFELLDKYSGEELVKQLEDNIEDYSWPIYSKLQDTLYAATEDKDENSLIDEIENLKTKIKELEQKRSDLVENSLLIIKELDNRINEINN